MNLVFTARNLDGKEYSASVPDYLDAWLSHRVSPLIPSASILALTVVSAAFLIRRIWKSVAIRYFSFEPHFPILPSSFAIALRAFRPRLEWVRLCS